MTQDEIIEMARQAKLGFLLESGFMCHQEVKDFAKLVAKKAYLDGLENGIKAEREACLEIIDNFVDFPYLEPTMKAIRAREKA
jgi:hypothetical protein